MPKRLDMQNRSPGLWVPQAYVLLVDVVGFSEREYPEQLRVLKHLDSVLTDTLSATGLDRHAKRELNFTGDGFLIAFLPGPRAQPETVLSAAEAFVSGVKTFEPNGAHLGLEVRAAIHSGGLRHGMGLFGLVKQFSGECPNRCSRISTVSGPSQIVVSEKFFEMLCQTVGDGDAAARFSGPIDVPVKHGRLEPVRLRTGDAFGGRMAPRLRRLQTAHSYLEVELRDIILNNLATYLSDGKGPIDLPRVQPRITLWAVDATGRELRSTAYRYCLGAAAGGPSRVRYSRQPPEGVVGHAAATSQTRHRLDLPDPIADRAAYVRELGLAPAQVDKFSRLSRAFCSVPCAVGPGAEVSAVICLDFLDPLTGMETKVEDVLLGILEARAERIAALWELRCA